MWEDIKYGNASCHSTQYFLLPFAVSEFQDYYVQNCNFACHFIRVFVSHILDRKIFGPDREEAKGHCIKSHNEELYEF